MLRVMGKREIGKLSVFDLVISIMIAEIAVMVLEDEDISLFLGVVPMITLVFIQVLIAFITLKSRKLRQWFDGKPSLLIENGKLNRSEMQRQRYNLDDLLLQLRENRINNVADVEFAILETSGKLTVVPKEVRAFKDRNQGLPEQRKFPFRYEGLPMALIMDGKVQDENLTKIGQTRFWLKNKLQEQGVTDFKKVFLCSVDYKGKLYIDRKK
ncbi:membrane protein [Paenibacillus swuensis]|uniref:Membrane protein n=1 Tax=Paenibacillus swuensis TaxID=1178515 RepID=A0A172TPT6_9BACL|nr:DUF421 domain-containing protein [Paenibacillus swuensis]ANE48924.1 membrane protein [Paenibacillus swuensis]